MVLWLCRVALHLKYSLRTNRWGRQLPSVQVLVVTGRTGCTCDVTRALEQLSCCMMLQLWGAVLSWAALAHIHRVGMSCVLCWDALQQMQPMLLACNMIHHNH